MLLASTAAPWNIQLVHHSHQESARKRGNDGAILGENGLTVWTVCALAFTEQHPAHPRIARHKARSWSRSESLFARGNFVSMYLLVSFPCDGTTEDAKERRWELLQQQIDTGLIEKRYDRLRLPKLRVGTLDSLMTLSDDLVKVNTFMDMIVSKLKRQAFEFSTEGSNVELLVDGVTPEDYITQFNWEEAKYPSNRPMKETVEKIQANVGRIEDDLKVKLGEYTQLKGLLSSVTRKTTGSLAVRDLSGIVKAEDVHLESDYMTVLLVVVSKFNVKEWDSTYERLTDKVVPRSARVLHEDNEYALFKVVVFEKDVEAFRTAARSKGFQVRDFDVSGVEENTGEELERLKEDTLQKKQQLEEWCSTAYGEVFSAWIHVLSIRLFVESVMRYGLPPQFIAGLIEPKPKGEKKLRQMLDTFGDKAWMDLEDDGNAGSVLGPMAEADSLPYVCFNLTLD